MAVVLSLWLASDGFAQNSGSSGGSSGGQGGGQDPARTDGSAGTGPLTGRFDLWTFYQENADGSGSWRETARIQQAYQLTPGGWKLGLRADLPLVYTDRLGVDNSDGDWSWGWGDALVQAALTTPDIAPDLALSFGFRMILPTGDDAPFGGWQYKAAPHIGLIYDAGDWAEGLTFEPVVRYVHGFSSTRDAVSLTREWDLFPIVNYKFSPRWSVNLWNEHPIIYNDRSGRWFVPVDAMAVHSLNETWQVGLGAAVPVIDDDPQYDHIIYGRISARF